jgi:hypothetical protein
VTVKVSVKGTVPVGVEESVWLREAVALGVNEIVNVAVAGTVPVGESVGVYEIVGVEL